jgi:hypothetical protein
MRLTNNHVESLDCGQTEDSGTMAITVFVANVCVSMFDQPSHYGLDQHVLRRPFPIFDWGKPVDWAILKLRLSMGDRFIAN